MAGGKGIRLVEEEKEKTVVIRVRDDVYGCTRARRRIRGDGDGQSDRGQRRCAPIRVKSS